MLLYLPESTAVRKGKILGRDKNKKINLKLILETIQFVSILFIFEKKMEIIRPKKPNKKINVYRIIWGNFHPTSFWYAAILWSIEYGAKPQLSLAFSFRFLHNKSKFSLENSLVVTKFKNINITNKTRKNLKKNFKFNFFQSLQKRLKNKLHKLYKFHESKKLQEM